MGDINDPRVHALAARLYCEMERLDPGPDDVEWEELPPRDREFYLLSILSILKQKQTLLELLADDDLVPGHSHEGK